MATILLAFLLLSALTPALTRALSVRVFYVIALLPAAAFAWTLGQTGAVTAGGAVTESIPWIPQLGVSLSFRVAPADMIVPVATGVARRWVTIGERLTRLVAARLGRRIH